MEKGETKMMKNEEDKEDEKENRRENLHVVRFCVKSGGGTRTPYGFENVVPNLILQRKS